MINKISNGNVDSILSPRKHFQATEAVMALFASQVQKDIDSGIIQAGKDLTEHLSTPLTPYK